MKSKELKRLEALARNLETAKLKQLRVMGIKDVPAAYEAYLNVHHLYEKSGCDMYRIGLIADQNKINDILVMINEMLSRTNHAAKRMKK